METNQNYEFNKPIAEIIRTRKSVRSYLNTPLDDKIKKKLNKYIETLQGPFDIKVNLKIVNSDMLNKDSDVKLGTYGIIRGASSFILSAVEDDEMNLEQLGFQFEKLVLFATSLGLGTCWLGGTFKKGEFAKAMNLKQTEILPIVSPIGVPRESRSFIDSLMRFTAGSDNRKDWSELFFDANFDTALSIANATAYSTVLEMVRLAPSASNKQPWRIVKDNNGFHFYLSHTKGYSSALGFDMQRIDIGIAMCHFELTAKELGLKGSWKKINPSIKPKDNNIEYIVSWL